MRKILGIWPGLLTVWIGGMLISGCGTTGSGDYVFQDDLDPYGSGSASGGASTAPGTELRVGDQIGVTFSGNPVVEKWPAHQEKIKEDGSITLPYLDKPVIAAGKTIGVIQREIHDLYVPKILVRLTVSVQVGDQFFTVSGEVRNSSRQIYKNRITLVQAIASAQGFTDFAQRKKIRIIRANGKTEVINYEKILKNPSLDVEIYPGDRIIVPRRWL